MARTKLVWRCAAARRISSSWNRSVTDCRRRNAGRKIWVLLDAPELDGANITGSAIRAALTKPGANVKIVGSRNDPFSLGASLWPCYVVETMINSITLLGSSSGRNAGDAALIAGIIDSVDAACGKEVLWEIPTIKLRI